MRVLHLIARMNVGGTATYLANLIKGLQDKGVENLLVMGNVPPGEAEDNVVDSLKHHRVSCLSRKLSLKLDFKASREIEDVISEFKPDIIHTHTFKAGFLIRLKKRQTPVIHSFHGHHLYDPEFGFLKKNILNFIERRLAPRAEALVTIGKKVGQELLAVGIGREEQYLSIPPGITPLEKRGDGPRSQFIGEQRTRLREKFGYSERDVLILWLGRFTQVKRPDRVVELARLNPEVFFLMAGGGELMKEIQESAPSNLKVLGFQDKNEIWSIADIALCTSDSEGMPLSLIEAQMAGVPVLSTDVGSVSEILSDGETGRLADRDTRDLSEKLGLLLKDISQGPEMAQRARAKALEEFSSEVMVNSHLSLYRRVLGKVEQ